MRKTISIFAAFVFAAVAIAQNAPATTGETLRLDIYLSGHDSTFRAQTAAISRFDGWSGPAAQPSEPERIMGNFIFRLTDEKSKKNIYADGFSSLHCEWETTDFEGKTDTRFEHTVVMPMPKRKATFELKKLNPDGTYTTVLREKINPKKIKPATFGPKPRVKELHTAGKPAESLDILILAEAFTAAEEQAFDERAAMFWDKISAVSPFSDYKSKINCRTAFLPSADSGPSVPHEGKASRTVVGSSFDTFASERYLETLNTFAVSNYAADVPYDMIVILVNTEQYGGGGVYNNFAIGSAYHRLWFEVLLHEIGHSFAGLADEYYYPGDIAPCIYRAGVEPWEPNITTMADFASKWKDLYDSGEAGLIEGAGYSGKGVYRSEKKCLMRSLDKMCKVCHRAFVERIKFYVK